MLDLSNLTQFILLLFLQQKNTNQPVYQHNEGLRHNSRDPPRTSHHRAVIWPPEVDTFPLQYQTTQHVQLAVYCE